jgi:hypothetical protein
MPRRNSTKRSKAPKKMNYLASQSWMATAERCQSTGKLKFNDEYDAERNLRRAQRQHGQSDKMEQRWYKCRDCDGYHLTSIEVFAR